MNKIYVICEVRLNEPFEHAIGTIYRVGIVRGWKLLSGSTSSERAIIGLKVKDFRKYYDESPKKGKMYDPIKGMNKFMEHLTVIDIRDITL